MRSITVIFFSRVISLPLHDAWSERHFSQLHFITFSQVFVIKTFIYGGPQLSQLAWVSGFSYLWGRRRKTFVSGLSLQFPPTPTVSLRKAWYSGYATAKDLTSRQKESPYGKRNNLMAKRKTSRQKKKIHGKRSFSVRLFFLPRVFLFLPWGFSFCREVISFAVTVVGHCIYRCQLLSCHPCTSTLHNQTIEQTVNES